MILNLSDDSAKPRYLNLDPQDIIALSVNPVGVRSELKITTKNGTFTPRFSPQECDEYVGVIVEALKMHGMPLVEIPTQDAHDLELFKTYKINNKLPERQFVNAAEICYVTHSGTLSDSIGVEIGLKGHYSLKTVMTQQEAEEIISAAQAGSSRLIRFDPSQLNADWREQGCVYIDPSMTTMVSAGAMHMEVAFEGKGKLFLIEGMSVLMNDFNKSCKDVPYLMAQEEIYKQNITEIAGQLAAANKDMVMVKGISRSVYVCPKDIVMVETCTKPYGIGIHLNGDNTAEFYIENEADFRLAVDMLHAQINKPRTPQAALKRWPSVH